MNALIPIIQSAGRPAVSARELYRFLELRPGDYSRWAENNIVNNPFASRGEDWEVFRTDAENPQGGRPSQDYLLTLPLAKKLAMMSKSPRGEQVRDYFLECERLATRPTAAPDLSDALVTARLLQDATARFIEAETAKRTAERQLAEQAPAVAFARKVELSPLDVPVGAFAKSIGWGPIRLHRELRRRGFTYRLGGHCMPKQAHVSAGLFTVKQVPVGTRVFPVAAITGKGQLRLARELGIECQPSLALASW